MFLRVTPPHGSKRSPLAGSGRSVGAAALAVATLLLASPHAAAAPGWTNLTTKDGTQVEKRTDKQGDWVRVSKTLSTSCAQIKRTLRDIETYDRWMQIDDWRLVEQDANSPVFYGAHALPFPFDDRDYVVRYRIRDEGGAFFVEAKSITTKKKVPARGVRLDAVFSEWRVAKPAAGEGCAVSYREHSDLGGAFPAFLLDGAWKDQGPAMMAALEKASARHQAPPRAHTAPPPPDPRAAASQPAPATTP